MAAGNSLDYKSLKSLHTYLLRMVEKRLWLKVLIAMILGTGIGALISPDFGWVQAEISQTIGNWLALPGKLFLKLVQMIMIPLIFSSIIQGITSNNMNQLRKMGLGVIGYFILTTTVSISIGAVLALWLKPGDMIHQAQAENHQLADPSMSERGLPGMNEIPTAISDLLPSNPLASMVTGEMLSIVIFTIIIGVAITSVSDKVKRPINIMLGATQEICMTIVNWAMRIVPLAVFGLLVQLTSSVGTNSISSIGIYVAVVLAGLFALLVFYILMIGLVGRRSPFRSLAQMRDVQLLAFSTTSSAAVMPLSLKTAEEKLKISPSISNFVIPVGATVNMDGTAIYQAVTTLFVAQAYGLEMNIASIVLVMVTVVAASIGTPAIPGGGIVILASVFQSAGIPADGIMIIIGVERILGMFRTAVNVTGDLTACMVFDRWHKSTSKNN